MPLSVQNFVQQTANLQQTDHVRLKTDQQGNETAVRSKSNFGTKAAEWFRDTLSIKDPATKAFKTAIRAQVSEQQAQTIFGQAGISASKPLTRQQIDVAAQSLAQLLAPPPQLAPQNQNIPQLPLQQAPLDQSRRSSVEEDDAGSELDSSLDEDVSQQPDLSPSEDVSEQRELPQHDDAPPKLDTLKQQDDSQDLGLPKGQDDQQKIDTLKQQDEPHDLDAPKDQDAPQKLDTIKQQDEPQDIDAPKGQDDQQKLDTLKQQDDAPDLDAPKDQDAPQQLDAPIDQGSVSQQDAPLDQSSQGDDAGLPKQNDQGGPKLQQDQSGPEHRWVEARPKALDHREGTWLSAQPRGVLRKTPPSQGPMPGLQSQQSTGPKPGSPGQTTQSQTTQSQTTQTTTTTSPPTTGPSTQSPPLGNLPQDSQRPAPTLSTLPELAQKNWKSFEEDVQARPNAPITVFGLLTFAGSLPRALADDQRQALVDFLADRMDVVAGFAEKMENFIAPDQWQPFATFFSALVDASGLAKPELTSKAQAWLDKASAGVAAPIGERLATERTTLAGLTEALAKPDADRQQILGEFGKMGGKMIAAIMEQPVEKNKAFGGEATQTGVVNYDQSRLGDVAGLLASGGDFMPMGELIPDPMGDPAFLKVFQDATVDFAKTYGTAAAIAALHCLAQAGAPDEMTAPLRDHIAQAIGDRSGVEKIALHGSTMMPRVIDPTASFARQMVLAKAGKDLAFGEVQKNGVKLAPPELEPKVDPTAIKTAKSLDDILGAGFKLKTDDGSSIQANGRTLRFTAEDGTVVALKFMRANETPGKLQREHESFDLMKTALGGDFAASPRKLGPDADQSMIRLPKDLLPDDARKALEQELAAKGMTAFTEDDAFLVTSYEVEASVGDKFFNYLESSKDDAAFKQGFTDSMSALGKMAAKGYFNPNLIQNAYHSPASGPGDSEHARGWIWSVNLLQPSKDNTGKEDQQLANAQYSNFREGGLADPDEFRHMDHLRTGELAKLLGDPVIASELQSEDSNFNALLPTYLIGRMVHEAVVIATRRMVDEGAFAEGTSPERRKALVDTFKESVKAGIEAFAEGFTGKDGSGLAKALLANGLDLDKVLDKVAEERASLFSFEYAGKMREMDADYFGNLFGVDATKIEFDPPDDERMRDNGKLTPLADILKSPDPMKTFDETQQPGFTTILITDKDGTIKQAVDLGWMSNNLDQHADIFTDGEDGIGKVELRSTQHKGNLAIIEAGDDFDVQKYLDATKAKAHPYQNIGGFNATYFFQNEQHLNHILASTLVELRAG